MADMQQAQAEAGMPPLGGHANGLVCCISGLSSRPRAAWIKLKNLNFEKSQLCTPLRTLGTKWEERCEDDALRRGKKRIEAAEPTMITCCPACTVIVVLPGLHRLETGCADGIGDMKNACIDGPAATEVGYADDGCLNCLAKKTASG